MADPKWEDSAPADAPTWDASSPTTTTAPKWQDSRPVSTKVSVQPEAATPTTGLMQNARQDLRDLKTGTSALAANIIKPAYMISRLAPTAGTEEGRKRAGEMLDELGDQYGRVIKALPSTGRAMVSDYKQLFTHPGRALYEHPINQPLNALALVDILGGVGRLGIRGVGEGARLAGAETIESGARNILEGSPSILPAGKTVMPQVLSKNPIIQMAQKALIGTAEKVPGVSDVLSLPGIRAMVPPGAITEDARMALQAGKFLKRTTLASSAEHIKESKKISEVDKLEHVLDKKLSNVTLGERDAFIAIIQGTAVPYRMSPEFHDAYEWYKNKILSEKERYNLPEETAERVAYQPYVLAAKARYDEPLATTVLKNDIKGLKFEADRGNMSAIRQVYENAAKGDAGARDLVGKWNKEVKIMRLKQAEAGVKNFLHPAPDETAIIKEVNAMPTVERMKEALKITSKKELLKRASAIQNSKEFIENQSKMGIPGLDPDYMKTSAMEIAAGQVIKERRMLRPPRPALSPAEAQAAKDIARELTPEPIYFPHVFADKLKISDFIRLPNRLQKFRPAFLKARTGAEGYIETDPAYALSVHEKQIQKFKSTETLVNGVLDKFAEPLPSPSDLKAGYRVFAPEGAFKFYRTYLNFQDQFLKGLGLSKNIDDAYISAANSIMNTEVPEQRAVIGVRRAPMYQIPQTVAAKLTDELKTYNWPSSIHPIMNLVYDKPMDAFRYTVLGFRPGWVLHTTAGQVVTSLLSRVNLAAGIKKELSPEIMKAMEPVMGEVEASGFRASEKRLMGASRVQGSNALERGASAVGRVLFSNEPVMEDQAVEATRKLLSFPIRAAKGFADSMFEANSRIEDIFRKAVAIEKTQGMAVAQATKDTARSFFDARQAWDKFMGRGEFSEGKIVERMKKLAENPDTRSEILDSTFKVLNNYAGLNSFERGVVRRVIPFWSWWKFINTFAVRTAFQDPVMADLARYASHFGNDIERQEWEKNGLDVKEIPIWRRGGTIVGARDGGKTYEVMSGRNPSPFQALGAERINVSPWIKIIYEMKSGKNFDTGEKFSDPSTTEVAGKIYERTGKKEVRQVAQGATPDLPSEIMRSFFPPVAEVEQLMHPYKYYQTSPLLGKHAPMPDARGHAQEVSAGKRLANLMGLPVDDVQRISAIKNRVAQTRAIREFLKEDVMRKRAERDVK